MAMMIVFFSIHKVMHCVKSVKKCLREELQSKSLYSVRIQENTDQK